ncbi:hypothetical protein [Mycolicibacterium sp.]|uniref:hypothetical protein n=1 Tax=Mycolicibacterium sp. TaxID=2320850 RepID=UPI001A1A7E23|nr:hypothetical protein [Mycolicibacterium sp.]MBJ7341921.1 hypothetical protein [Mycolicibacterium sp.]
MGEIQSELDEGPGITALRDHHTVHIDDMSQEAQWPRFAEAAFVDGEILGQHAAVSMAGSEASE